MPTSSPSSLPSPTPHAAIGVAALAAACGMALALAACGERGAPAGPAAADAKRAAKLLAPPTARFVKLEQLTEWNGKAWASVAELNLIDSTGATVDRAGWSATADSADPNDSPANAIDGNPNTLWHTRWDGVAPPPPHALIIALGGSVKLSGFRYLPRQDNIGNGTIAKYRFYVSNDGQSWGEPVSDGDFANLSAPRTEKVVVFAEQTKNHPPVASAPPPQTTPLGRTATLQIVASDDDADPLTFAATGLPTGLTLSPTTGVVSGTPIVAGSHAVKVSVSDNKGLTATVAFDWTVQAPAAIAGAAGAGPGEVRFVKLEQVTEQSGKPWGSIAELNLLDAQGATLPRAGWVASADSADANDAPAAAIDGNPGSLWHTQWNGASPPPPHSFIVDMGRSARIGGFRYLPRQDKQLNGMIARFRFYTSVDGVEWGQPVAEGDFSTMGSPSAEKTVSLK